MTKDEFNHKIDRIYKAVRKAEGYTEESEELIDFLCDVANVSEGIMTEG